MKISALEKVACVGAGTIGASWASYFLWKKIPTRVQDVNETALEKARLLIDRNLGFLASKGMMTAQEVADAKQRCSYFTSVIEAVSGVQFIQESAFESYQVKRAILEEIDTVNPNAIFASSTSGLLISEIQVQSKYPGRCITAHPFNPPHLVPLVELVLGRETDEATFQTAYDFYKAIGKMPIRLNKEVPGHIANRIAMALWRECIDLVMNGVCSAEDVDLACCYGPGLRLSLMGPHLIYQLGGGEKGVRGIIDHIGPSIEMWWDDMATWQRFPEGCRDVLEQGVNEEMSARKNEEGRTASEIAAWRDDKLVEVLRLLNRI